jgi:ubiquinone/menaquinone biosynthesis C-methylase UbiE
MPEQPSWINDPEKYNAYAEDYLGELGLNAEHLKDKKSLEVGAGSSRISKYAKEHGLDITFLDDSFDSWRERGYLLKTEGLPYVQAQAEALPFKDETFDLVFSNGAPPIIYDTEAEVTAQINETMRVLRPGGEFRFSHATLSIDVLAAAKELDDKTAHRLWTTDDTPENTRVRREASLRYLRRQWPSVSLETATHPDYNEPRYFFKIRKAITPHLHTAS